MPQKTQNTPKYQKDKATNTQFFANRKVQRDSTTCFLAGISYKTLIHHTFNISHAVSSVTELKFIQIQIHSRQ